MPIEEAAESGQALVGHAWTGPALDLVEQLGDVAAPNLRDRPVAELRVNQSLEGAATLITGAQLRRLELQILLGDKPQRVELGVLLVALGSQRDRARIDALLDLVLRIGGELARRRQRDRTAEDGLRLLLALRPFVPGPD